VVFGCGLRPFRVFHCRILRQPGVYPAEGRDLPIRPQGLPACLLQKRLEDCPRPDKILNAVASAFGEPQARLVEKQGQNNTAKKVAIYLMKRYTCGDNKEIGQVFGGLHYSAVSKAAARLEKELSKDKDLAKIVSRLVSNVKV
jgi:hypothetical protein